MGVDARTTRYKRKFALFVYSKYQSIMKRKLILLASMLLCVITINAETISGTCGADGSYVNWSLDLTSGLFTVRGTGAMRDYTFHTECPWHQYRRNIEVLNIVPGITEIGRLNFASCNNLENVVIQEGVTLIRGEAFANCTSLNFISFPNTLTRIAPSAFAQCTSLSSLHLPSSLTNITTDAFANCSALTYIICEAITPPTLSSGVFTEVNKSIPLYVPIESVNLYKNAYGWKDFYNIHSLQEIPTAISTVAKEETYKKIFHNGQVFVLSNERTYNMQGQQVK